MAKIRSGKVDPPASRITSPSPPSGHISFSYRYLAVTPGFTTGDCEPYQFQISRNSGRVHGFFIDLIFHIVRFDPHHRLYP